MQIRNATSEDLSDILKLVHDLAVYEKAPEQVTATLDDYQQNFSKGVFDALVAANGEGDIVGTSIFYLTWSTWRGRMLYLEDFVVQEASRQSGIGQLLFDATIRRAKDLDCVMMKWQVLDWNLPAIKFYEKNNATLEKEWWNGKIIF